MNNDSANQHSLSTLSFVKSKDGAITSMWDVTPTGDWDKDFQTGKGYANEVIARMAGRKSFGVLYQVAKGMPRSKFGGIECGFFSQIGEAAAFGAPLAFGAP